MTTNLIKYEAARRALAEAVKFDEVIVIKNVADQAALYARQANDNELIKTATEIKVRAERKAGEILVQAKQAGQLDSGNGGDRKSRSSASTVKLADIGVTKDQSSRWQTIARMPEKDFESAIDKAKQLDGEVKSSRVLSEAKKVMPVVKKPKKITKEDLQRQALRAAMERAAAMSPVEKNARELLNYARNNHSFTEVERELISQIAALLETAQ